MTALSTGKLTGRRGVICPKCLFKCGFEHLMTFRADVFYMIKVIPADQYPPGNSRQYPDGKRPPNTFDDPENDGKPLQRRDRDSGQDHHPAHLLQFFLAFHYESYVTDGFERECRFTFQSVFQLMQFFQLFLFIRNLI